MHPTSEGAEGNPGMLLPRRTAPPTRPGCAGNPLRRVPVTRREAQPRQTTTGWGYLRQVDIPNRATHHPRGGWRGHRHRQVPEDQHGETPDALVVEPGAIPLCRLAEHEAGARSDAHGEVRRNAPPAPRLPRSLRPHLNEGIPQEPRSLDAWPRAVRCARCGRPGWAMGPPSHPP